MKKWKRKNPKRKTEETRLELCDLCAATFPESEATCGCVPDSSSVRSDHERFDGLRLGPACSEPHLAVVREIHRHRPFTYEELWAAEVPGP